MGGGGPGRGRAGPGPGWLLSQLSHVKSRVSRRSCRQPAAARRQPESTGPRRQQPPRGPAGARRTKSPGKASDSESSCRRLSLPRPGGRAAPAAAARAGIASGHAVTWLRVTDSQPEPRSGAEFKSLCPWHPESDCQWHGLAVGPGGDHDTVTTIWNLGSLLS